MNTDEKVTKTALEILATVFYKDGYKEGYRRACTECIRGSIIGALVVALPLGYLAVRKHFIEKVNQLDEE